MGRQTLHIDIAIIGGGIAGLWTLNQLRAAGYSALLFEREALGSCQTIGSQGMIHGGIKYALGGKWGDSSQAISAMPDIWRRCLAGDGAVDLRDCKVLSDEVFLWSSGDLRSSLSTFFASRMMRGRIKKMKPQDYPQPLRSGEFKGQVYRAHDLVLDLPSLVSTLAKTQRHAISQIDWSKASLARAGNRAQLELDTHTLVPQCLLLTAGAGNEQLMADLGCTAPAMQRRPLQQVMVRHAYPEPLHGHCLGGGSSPRLTISSHLDKEQRPVWYLGGELATASGEQSPAGLIEQARAELHSVLPWVDFGPTEWATVKLDRAEPDQSSGLRPDNAFVAPLQGVDNALVAWPTKLALAPSLASQATRQLQDKGIEPRHPQPEPPTGHKPPLIAQPYWNTPLSWIG